MRVSEEFIELSRAYLGLALISADALTGWHVCNFIVNYILGAKYFI